MTDVFLNGKFVGEVENTDDFLSNLKLERRRGAISSNVNVQYDGSLKRICVETSKGRTRRPLIIVQDGATTLTERHIKQLTKNEISWNELVEQGIVEYLDAAEEENALIAFSQEEITPEGTNIGLRKNLALLAS
ncbi:DNA-directed RNA polymerase subunit B, partial [Nanoarchaeota archaeon]